MDPHSVDPSLQKTSPKPDPAAVDRLTSEVSAQASVIALHQQQLAHLTSLTEEVVKTLQNLHLPSPETSLPPSSRPSQVPVSSHSTTSPRLAYPYKFDVTPGKCRGFLLQCSLFVSQQPLLYPTEESRIAFVCSLLTHKALDWATAVWDLNRPVFPPFEDFLRRFREVFDIPRGGEGAGKQILSLRQGRSSAAEFALTFRTLAAPTGWPDDPLKLHFRQALNMDLQSELACRDEGKTLDQIIDLTVRIDNLIRSKRPNRGVSPLIQLTFSNMNPCKWDILVFPLRREIVAFRGICLYCGQPGHMRVSCPTRPKQHTSTTVSESLHSSMSKSTS